MAVKMKKFWETAELVQFIPDFEERAMKFLSERPASSVAALKAQVAELTAKLAEPPAPSPPPAERKFIWSLLENHLEVAALQTLERIPG